MKISDESKIGLIAILAITVLFLGFSYLKGKKLFSKETNMYAVYDNVMGLKKSNKVTINGQSVGKIENIDGGRDMRKLIVTISFYKDVDIPENSLAVISPDIIGSTSLEIKLGDAHKFLKDGDTLKTMSNSGALDAALKALNPALFEVKNAASSLDTLLQTFAEILDTNSKRNIKDILRNLDITTQAFTASSQALQTLMNPQSGALVQTINNTNQFTRNLNGQSGQIDSILHNVNNMSNKFAKMELQSTIDSLTMTIHNLNAIAQKMNSGKGTLGAMMNDKALYNNLNATSNKLNILLDDIRVNPKRYINFSVFGKKDKGNYLTAPLIDDTLTLRRGTKPDTIKVVSQ